MSHRTIKHDLTRHYKYNNNNNVAWKTKVILFSLKKNFFCRTNALQGEHKVLSLNVEKKKKILRSYLFSYLRKIKVLFSCLLDCFFF